MPQFDNYNPKQWHFEMSTHPRIIKPNLQTYNQNFVGRRTSAGCGRAESRDFWLPGLGFSARPKNKQAPCQAFAIR
jgi:hypothetical protein